MSELILAPVRAAPNPLQTLAHLNCCMVAPETNQRARPSLMEAAHCFISQSGPNPDRLFRVLLSALREAVGQGQEDAAAAAIRSVAGPKLDYSQAQALGQIRKSLRGRIKSRRTVKLATTGSFTTKQLLSLVDLMLFAAGVDVELYESDYGVFRQEIIDPTSQLYQFAPQVLFLATSRRDISARPKFTQSEAEVSKLAQEELSNWSSLWDLAYGRVGCQVIQNNFVLPPWRAFANFEMRQPASAGHFMSQLNGLLAETKMPHVIIHDVDALAAAVGRWRWDDPRFFYQAKMPCNPECLVDYAHSVASLIAAQQGLSKKCLALDLDNTLWGGVIGDDGLLGIRLGQGDPEGEAFVEFQRYARALRDRGILLAVCSKNNAATALEVFEQHPEMALHKDDIACFVANWDDKAANLRLIAEQLNIGLDSLVFVDDNPAERAIVRQLVPEVAVPELPPDISGWIQALEQQRYFQTLSVVGEDFQRAEYYRAETLRREVKTSAADIESFLRSLEMVAAIGPVTAATTERAAQLIQRSNQFNLTTRRRSAAELSRFISDPAWMTRTVSLADRFGDNGLISVLLAVMRDGILEIDTWLMSCRVLKRGVEQFLLNDAVRFASSHQLRAIRGIYIPSPKNAMVKDHYAGLGFIQTAAGDDGRTEWELTLTENWKPLITFIQ